MSKENEPYSLPSHEDKFLNEQEVRAIVSSSVENIGMFGGGAGDEVFKFDRTKGIWLGNAKFGDALFRVSMAGDLIATSATISGAITITGGSGIANLSDAGSLAVLDDVGAGNCDTTIISGGKIITGLLTATNIQTGNLTGITVRTGSSGQRIVMTGDNFSSFSGSNTYAEVVLDSKELWFNMGSSEFGGSSGTKMWQSDNGTLSVMAYTGALDATFKVVATASFEGIYTNKALSVGGSITVGGTVDGIDIASHAGNVSAHHNLQCINIWMQPNGVTSHSYMRPSTTNAYDLGTSSYYWQDLYLNNKIYFGNTSYYLTHDGNVFKINDDLQPIADGSKRLGYTNMAWYAVHSDNYLGCNLPASKTGIDIFKKIKSPKLKDGKAKGYHAGKRHYFEINEFPDEMKMIDKDTGEKDIELTRTTGVMVSAVRELIEKLDNFNSRLEALENKFK